VTERWAYSQSAMTELSLVVVYSYHEKTLSATVCSMCVQYFYYVVYHNTVISVL